MEIRLLEPGDTSVLDRVTTGVFDGPVLPVWRDRFMALPNHHIVVAVDGNEVVGMVSAVDYVHPDKPPQLWINEVAVAPAYRRRHIARRARIPRRRGHHRHSCSGAKLRESRRPRPDRGDQDVPELHAGGGDQRSLAVAAWWGVSGVIVDESACAGLPPPENHCEVRTTAYPRLQRGQPGTARVPLDSQPCHQVRAPMQVRVPPDA